MIRAPQLTIFLRRASGEDEAWAAALLARLREEVGAAEIESWSIDLTPARAPTVCHALASGEVVTLRRLMRRSNAPEKLAHAVPLLSHRGKQRLLCPALDLRLVEGDEVPPSAPAACLRTATACASGRRPGHRHTPTGIWPACVPRQRQSP